jgi:hypothetical protein
MWDNRPLNINFFIVCLNNDHNITDEIVHDLEGKKPVSRILVRRVLN